MIPAVVIISLPRVLPLPPAADGVGAEHVLDVGPERVLGADGASRVH